MPEKPADSEAAKWSEADGNDSNELRHRQAGHINRHGFHPLGLHGNSALQRTTGALDPLPWSAKRISNHMIHMAFLQLVDLGNKRQLNKIGTVWHACELTRAS